MCTGELSSKIFLLFHPVFRLNLKHPGLILGVPELLSDHSSTGMWPLWKILLLLLAPGAHAQGLPSHHLKCPWGNNNNYYHNKKITKEEQCQWNGPSLHTGPGQRAGLEIPKGRWCGCASPSMGWFVPGHNRRERRHLPGNLILTLPLSGISIQTPSQTCICFSFYFLAILSCFSFPYPRVKHFSDESVQAGVAGVPWFQNASLTLGCSASHHCLLPSPAHCLSLASHCSSHPQPCSRMSPGLDFQPVGPCQATFL